MVGLTTLDTWTGAVGTDQRFDVVMAVVGGLVARGAQDLVITSAAGTAGAEPPQCDGTIRTDADVNAAGTRWVGGLAGATD